MIQQVRLSRTEPVEVWREEREGSEASLSPVERVALEASGYELLYGAEERTPVIVVSNFQA